MKKREKVLIIIRTEADFERVVAISKYAKDSHKLELVFCGDFSPFYSEGISNQFQKKLLSNLGVEVNDFSDYDLFSRIIGKLLAKESCSIINALKNKKFFKFILFKVFLIYIAKRKKVIVRKVFDEIKPDYLLTDQSLTDETYLPEMFRTEAIYRDIKVGIFTHGAAGGLHSAFYTPEYQAYDGCIVFVCNKNETTAEYNNRIVLGDVCSGYDYVHFLNSLEYEKINFLNNRKYKIGFFIGGTAGYTSTSGWSIQEEIIIELSENKDVAMVLKVHPRDSVQHYLKMVEKLDNLLIVRNDVDRSRVSKWANIIVCNDHCSTIFEPMILGKKVVAVGGKHLPKYKNKHSPIKYSSVNYLTSSNDFDLDNLHFSDPNDKIINQIAWGGNGPINLAQNILNIVE